MPIQVALGTKREQIEMRILELARTAPDKPVNMAKVVHKLSSRQWGWQIYNDLAERGERLPPRGQPGGRKKPVPVGAVSERADGLPGRGVGRPVDPAQQARREQVRLLYNQGIEWRDMMARFGRGPAQRILHDLMIHREVTPRTPGRRPRRGKALLDEFDGRVAELRALKAPGSQEPSYTNAQITEILRAQNPSIIIPDVDHSVRRQLIAGGGKVERRIPNKKRRPQRSHDELVRFDQEVAKLHPLGDSYDRMVTLLQQAGFSWATEDDLLHSIARQPTITRRRVIRPRRKRDELRRLDAAVKPLYLSGVSKYADMAEILKGAGFDWVTEDDIGNTLQRLKRKGEIRRRRNVSERVVGNQQET